MMNENNRTVRTETARRDPKHQADRRVLAEKLFPGQSISYLDTCQPQERRESSRRVRIDRRP